MKIIFLCPSISRAGGGIFEIERHLAQSLARLPDTAVEIFGPADEHTQADLPAWEPLHPRYFPFSGPASFRYSAELRKKFFAEEAEIAHLHSLWTYNSILIRQWARRWKRPYVITVNGMLEPWAVRNSGWKKRMALILYERQCLNEAACLQVNSEAELRTVRAFGLKNPICVIPNGVDPPPDAGGTPEDGSREALPAAPGVGRPASPIEWEQGRKVLLYLGRIHPKKGLANLLRAWAATIRKAESGGRKPGEWVLALAGWDQGGHEPELKRLCAQLGLAWQERNAPSPSPLRPDRGEGQGEWSSPASASFPAISVLFLGPQFNEAKSACYRNCDAFILPSFSEGLPMVVLEAWSYGKPVLMTPACNLQEGFTHHAALSIQPKTEGIVDGLTQLFAMSDDERRRMGQNGLALVKGRFNWTHAATEMKSVYTWLISGGAKPGCVFINGYEPGES